MIAPGADHGPGVDQGPAAHRRARAQPQRRQGLALAGGAGGQPRLLAQHHVVLDHAAVADDGAVVDDHVGADLDVLADHDALAQDEVLAAHAPTPAPSRTGRPEDASDSVIASSTSTTAAPARAVGGRRPPVAHRLHEALAHQPQRLGDGHLGDVDVPRAHLDVLAVGLGAGDRPLVVDGDLALGLHVVEHHHLLGADHGHLAHLVGVEPAQVQVADDPRREADAPEDHVLDARLQVALAAGRDLGGALAHQPQHHGDVVGAQAPEGVLVGAHDAQVLPVAVEVEDPAQGAVVDQVLQRLHAGVVDQQVVHHQHAIARVGLGDQLVGVARGHRERLLHEDVLAGLEGQPGERVRGWARGWRSRSRRGRGRPAARRSRP